MVRNNEGLTKTYNRFHDPNETLARHPAAPRAARRDGPRRPRRLRLDRPASPPASSCSTTRRTKTRRDGRGRHRKKPWRYRWPDDFRDEVLARLLELNRQRAEEERLSADLCAGRTGPKPLMFGIDALLNDGGSAVRARLGGP